MYKKEQLDKYKEICKKASNDGFFERFDKHRELLNGKLILLKSLETQRKLDYINKNFKEVDRNFKKQSEIIKIIDLEEKKFMVKDGKNLKQLEKWLKDNPKKK